MHSFNISSSLTANLLLFLLPNLLLFSLAVTSYSKGLKGTTVTKYHANIRKALDYELQTDLISNNPVIKVGRPQQEQFIANYYNEEELNNLFKVVKDTTLELIVYLTAFYGLRRSEVLGIRWSAIDFENKTITISHKVVTVTDENENSKTKTKTITKRKTKNKSSYRTLPLFKEEWFEKNKISRFKTQLCNITFEKWNIIKRNTRLARTF